MQPLDQSKLSPTSPLSPTTTSPPSAEATKAEYLREVAKLDKNWGKFKIDLAYGVATLLTGLFPGLIYGLYAKYQQNKLNSKLLSNSRIQSGLGVKEGQNVPAKEKILKAARALRYKDLAVSELNSTKTAKENYLKLQAALTTIVEGLNDLPKDESGNIKPQKNTTQKKYIPITPKVANALINYKKEITEELAYFYPFGTSEGYAATRFKYLMDGLRGTPDSDSYSIDLEDTYFLPGDLDDALLTLQTILKKSNGVVAQYDEKLTMLQTQADKATNLANKALSELDKPSTPNPQTNP